MTGYKIVPFHRVNKQPIVDRGHHLHVTHMYGLQKEYYAYECLTMMKTFLQSSHTKTS